MKLRRQQLDHWPKLSWCANVADDTVNVLHGCRVEYADEWVFEGTWAGEFGRADFDREVPVIIGTGIRLRDNMVSFVCSTSPLDRLFYVDRKNELLVSNSLACLLSVSKVRLDPAFPYSKALSRFINSHQFQPRNLPTLDGDEIRVLIYDKLVYSKGAQEQLRISTEPNFTSFEEYERFLSAGISSIRDNLQDEQRRFKVAPVATISKGYDSAASTVIAKPLGIRSALTISRVGISRHDDSGEEVAEELGIPVKSVISRPSAYRDHDLVWAGLGEAHDFNLTLFDYPNDLTLLVVGTHGDVVWQKGLKQKFMDSHHFVDRDGDTSGCGLTEWRLHKGVFLASVPCIGASRLNCLKQINDSPAMDPWRIGGDYDRPIPRRILEQQGVRRGKFGIKKMATISGYRRFYPNDLDQLSDLEAFLEQHGKRLPRKFGKLTEPVHFLRKKLKDFARKRNFVKLARFVRLPDYDDLFFVWANSSLAKTHYLDVT
jgi:hypothetical protein